jgi:hypothetical protein
MHIKPSHGFDKIFIPLAGRYMDFCNFPKTIGSSAQLSNTDAKIIKKFVSLVNVFKILKTKAKPS